jgi:hypothetical protein
MKTTLTDSNKNEIENAALATGELFDWLHKEGVTPIKQ